MSDSMSVAPKERINIVYKPATGNQQSDVELPLKLLVIADFKGAAGDTSLEKREVLNVDAGSLDNVLASVAPTLNIEVANKLSADPNAKLNLNLNIKTMKDFHPDNISRNFPELGQLMELRDALRALRGPLGNVSEFRRALEKTVHDDVSRTALLKELNIAPGADGSKLAADATTDKKAK